MLVALVAHAQTAMADASSPGCADRQATTCVSHEVTADQDAADFHGLIMVPGQPSVLDRAAHGGTKAGCGDCSWELILACLTNSPNTPQDQNMCTRAGEAPRCAKGQLAYRLYLSTDAVRNQLVDVICLGGTTDVVPVGDQAAADVQRYLKDVSAPLLDLHVDPPKGIPAGLPSYFWVRPPTVTPAPFGGGQITETITIAPERYRWVWGDGETSGWTTDAGAPYPDGTLTHTYVKAGRYDGHVTAEWGGTYTITVAGQTFGPYDAIGTVTRDQPFSVTALKAHSTLVSHG
jgi:hypothetical protein